jgi:enoyl-CoA hydratase
MAHSRAKIRFNEAKIGFVPHSGASYYLSRLPGEIGTYAALTGNLLNGDDCLAAELTEYRQPGDRERFISHLEEIACG